MPSNNDDATHYLLIQRAGDALARGENVLDHWVPQLELGFPWFIYYQPLPALVVVALHRLLLGAVGLLTVFDAVRLVLLAGLPLTVFWSLRRMDVPLPGAVVAAAAAPLFSGDFRYGFEYDSYIWRGFGMYTQLWAMHLSFLTLACFYRLFTRGTGWRLAVLAMSGLVLSHLIYAYMAAISLAVLFVATVDRASFVPRLKRFALAAAACAAVTAWMWIPFVSSRAFLGVTTYLQPYKYDSFGAGQILGWLVTGDLLDHGRLPVLTVLLALGVVAALRLRDAISRAAVALFAVWLLLYFGRATLGPIADLLPFHEGMLMHRFVGSVDLAVVVLIGIGAAWLWRLARVDSPRRVALAGLACALVLAPAVLERASFYGWNTSWMRDTAAAIRDDADARAILATLATQPPGRVFAGLRDSAWGKALDFGIPFNSVRFSDLLVFDGYSVIASPYSSITLNADLMWDFDPSRRDHYDLFDVRYVVASPRTPVPAFLVPLRTTSRYTLYAAPTSGYAELVSLSGREAVATQAALFAANRSWLDAAEPGGRRFVRYDYPSAGSAAVSGPEPGCAGGIRYERALPAGVDVLTSCRDASTLVLKVTYHPNWRVRVDGGPAATFMVSPSFVGVSLPAGDHFVSAEYDSTPAKMPLFFLGVVAGGAIAAWPLARRRARLVRRLRQRAAAV